jgi:hypothetical protein
MNEYLINLKDYSNSLITLIDVHRQGIITEDELLLAEHHLREKYGIKKKSLFALNTLDIPPLLREHDTDENGE